MKRMLERTMWRWRQLRASRQLKMVKVMLIPRGLKTGEDVQKATEEKLNLKGR